MIRVCVCLRCVCLFGMICVCIVGCLCIVSDCCKCDCVRCVCVRMLRMCPLFGYDFGMIVVYVFCIKR